MRWKINQHALKLGFFLEEEDAPHRLIVSEETLRNGFAVWGRVSEENQNGLLSLIEGIVVTPEMANSTFHKSWEKIVSSSQEQLWLQAATHYMTTYGFRELGIYEDRYIYVPSKADTPEGEVPIRLFYGLPVEGMIAVAINLSHTASSDELLESLVAIASLNPESFLQTKNVELRVRVMEKYNVLPSDPVEYLRYFIYRVTGKSLLIKSPEVIERLATADPKIVSEFVENAPDTMAQIFYRFKPLLLALKKAAHPNEKAFFNRMRKRAIKEHVPMEKGYLDLVTVNIKRGNLDENRLAKSLALSNPFRAVRIAEALNYRLLRPAPGSITYVVRNGKGYTKEFEPGCSSESEDLVKARDVVLNHIRNVIANKVDSPVYIPEGVEYYLPTSEKKFVGNYPDFTGFRIDENLVFGFHWFNIKDRFVDLDLSVITKDTKIGWDSTYSDADNSILYSGDMTSAPRPDGASELFYVRKAVEPMLVYLNYYNHNGEVVDARLIVGSQEINNFHKNFMIAPESMIAQAQIRVTRKQNVIGVIVDQHYHITHFSVGNVIASRVNKVSVDTMAYLIAQSRAKVALRPILDDAGLLVDEVSDGVIDLSPNKITRDSIISFLV